ncbi:hypothetical protein SAMN05216311_114135 [Chitinophaga sp. CF418]|nr:hypothetical protein SAMN05216311_114135 [Chitinophaga sp. CF418]
MHRFRLVYFICHDKRIIAENVYMTDTYRSKEAAEAKFKPRDKDHRWAWEKNLPRLPVASIEGFYMVPAQLHELVLKSRKFRLMFFVCTNKQTFTEFDSSVLAFQSKKWADSHCGYLINYHKTNQTFPLPDITVEAFYLVTDQLFDELLRPWI